jgi:hypothetical protein
MFPPEGIIRVVAGESINPFSTQENSEQYPDQKHIHGFKVDFRFVVDVGKKEMATVSLLNKKYPLFLYLIHAIMFLKLI